MAYDQYLNDYYPRELDVDGAKRFSGYATLTPTEDQFAQMLLVLSAAAGKTVIVEEIRAFSTAGGAVKIGLYSTALTGLEADVAANRGATDSRIGVAEGSCLVGAKDNASQLVFTYGVQMGTLGAAGAWEYLGGGHVMEVTSAGAIMQLVVEGAASMDLTVSFVWREIDNTK